MNRTSSWLNKQIFQRQGRRDENLPTWWQLPDDHTRTNSPWSQLVVDLVSPATFSRWPRMVTKYRVQKYDRLRPFVARALFLSLTAAGLWALGARWLLLALAPAVLQVYFEIIVDKYIPPESPEPRSRLVAAMRDVRRGTYGSALFNVTGIIGIVACPANVVAVVLAPPGGGGGWIKIAAFAAAIFYLNSGLCSVFLDVPNYTENSDMPPFMHAVRPYAALVSYLIVTAIAAVGVLLGKWEPAMVPIAYLAASLTLLLGSTVRSHDRIVAAAIFPAREAIEKGRENLGRTMHDQLGSVKAAAESASQHPGVPFVMANDLATLAPLLTYFHTRTGIYDSGYMALDYLGGRILEPYGLWEHARYEVSWGELQLEDHEVAVTVTTALLNNVGQVLARPENKGLSKSIVVQGYTSGRGRDLSYHLAVTDHLPPISPFLPDLSSLDALRQLLAEDYDGGLEQQCFDGYKKIIATWKDQAPRETPRMSPRAQGSQR